MKKKGGICEVDQMWQTSSFCLTFKVKASVNLSEEEDEVKLEL